MEVSSTNIPTCGCLGKQFVSLSTHSQDRFSKINRKREKKYQIWRFLTDLSGQCSLSMVESGMRSLRSLPAQFWDSKYKAAHLFNEDIILFQIIAL